MKGIREAGSESGTDDIRKPVEWVVSRAVGGERLVVFIKRAADRQKKDRDNEPHQGPAGAAFPEEDVGGEDEAAEGEIGEMEQLVEVGYLGAAGGQGVGEGGEDDEGERPADDRGKPDARAARQLMKSLQTLRAFRDSSFRPQGARRATVSSLTGS